MGLNYKEDYSYANSRLANTVAMCDSTQIYIQNISDRGVVKYIPLNNQHLELTALYREVDLNPIQLGFVNERERRAEYMYRLPTRVQRQGLCDKNVVKVNGRVDFWTPAFVNCIMGVYPTVDNVVDRIVNNEANSLAFSRSFMLAAHNAISLKLCYKITGAVGAYMFNTGVFKFTPKYSFLKEALDITMEKMRNGR